MDDLIISRIPCLKDIEKYIVNGNYVFLGKDITDFLEYKNGKEAIKRNLEKDEWFVNYIDGKEIIYLTESGVFDLILSSRLPKAKEFRRWVTKDVLPTIRKYGRYDMIEDSIERAKAYIEYHSKLKELENKFNG